MTDRLIDLADGPARLHVKLERLIIDRESIEPVSIPLTDIAALVVSHPAVQYSQAVIAGLAAAGGIFVACDGRHMPIGMLLPLSAHHLQAERFAKQTEASVPMRKRLWKQLVEAKVSAQGRLLKQLYEDDHGLIAMAAHVQSGDTGNTEALAARKYWPVLFRDPAFRRNPEAEDVNALLNYGYAVLRAIVARAICAAGLHPSFGIHHHNRYDAFRLADDLMEPFRPLVDGAVARRVLLEGKPATLDKETKAAIIGALTGRFILDGEERTLFDVFGRVAVSLAEVFMGKRQQFVLPDFTTSD
ncbi:MAG: type II CRISPR-associated endonuclease Cas1 [Candidatus Hydrogenedentes bacterium]|nr:type II CRISPR-associated endonuclease Cas1 [Candidatus Hydrogenedentota bacterium]